MFAAIERRATHQSRELHRGADGPGEDSRELLLAKRAQGVQVNLLFDGFGSSQTQAAYFDAAARGWRALCEYNPLRSWARRQPGGASARPPQVADRRRPGGLRRRREHQRRCTRRLGSAGERPRARCRRRPAWRDTHVRIEGPLVDELQRCSGALAPPCARAPAPPSICGPLPHVGTHRVAVAACEAGQRRNPFYRALLRAIHHRAARVYITTAYFVPPRRLLRALEAAARRGVDVRLVLPGVTRCLGGAAAGRAHYGRLLAGGRARFTSGRTPCCIPRPRSSTACGPRWAPPTSIGAASCTTPRPMRGARSEIRGRIGRGAAGHGQEPEHEAWAVVGAAGSRA